MSTLQYYTGFTLVDITATGVTRGKNDPRRDQQSNWETVLQAISLGAQPMDIYGPVTINSPNIKDYQFGDFFEGGHAIWMWRFAVEHRDAFLEGSDPHGRLKRYFEQVPVITGLDETARFMLPIFYPHGSIRNIYFIDGLVGINSI
jgi:hypothetical protein